MFPWALVLDQCQYFAANLGGTVGVFWKKWWYCLLGRMQYPGIVFFYGHKDPITFFMSYCACFSAGMLIHQTYYADFHQIKLQ